jgi:hypothetical protein
MSSSVHMRSEWNLDGAVDNTKVALANLIAENMTVFLRVLHRVRKYTCVLEQVSRF